MNNKTRKYFITNQAKNSITLKKRVTGWLQKSRQLDFLVGYFYFSGFSLLFDELKARWAQFPDLKMRVLVGMSAGTMAGRLVEYGHDGFSTGYEARDGFVDSLKTVLGHPDSDRPGAEDFEEQAAYFLERMRAGFLEIRQSKQPVHAKLYLFHYTDEEKGLDGTDGSFIIGSSNMSAAGFQQRYEVNMGVRDFGFDEAADVFEELWGAAVPLVVDDVEAVLKRRLRVTPFVAYVKTLQTYVEMMQARRMLPQVERLLKERGYSSFQYQKDAVNQALSIIDQYGGVVVADVVGLGKSVIAAMIAKNLGQLGVVISPPRLMGDNKGEWGWWKYVRDFDLHGWEVMSAGKSEDVVEFLQARPEYRVVVVDEAHRYRNEDTRNYELLSAACKGRTVILLTATPFNNTPADIFSLLKLFIVPGKSGLAIDDNLEWRFRGYSFDFRRLSYILRYHGHAGEKGERARKHYRDIFNDQGPIVLDKVRTRVKEIADEIKHTIEPVMIRRNRLDLKRDPVYKKEVKKLSRVADPIEITFQLSKRQSAFYDRVVGTYFATPEEETGKSGQKNQFRGAIYQPFKYANPKYKKKSKRTQDPAMTMTSQANLADFMRRLLVKRFESSFGAFAKSIENAIKLHERVLRFMENSGYRYVLDRRMLERLVDADPDEVNQAMDEYLEDLEKHGNQIRKGRDGVYEFSRDHKFVKAVNADLNLLKMVRKQLDRFDIVGRKTVNDKDVFIVNRADDLVHSIMDPKVAALVDTVRKVLNKKVNPRPKVVIFTEYIDTVLYLEDVMQEAFDGRVLVVPGDIYGNLDDAVNREFDASAKDQSNDCDILLTTDKMSEGVNLNRAMAVFNYDIPWNPVRVIQRVGRINRIGHKVFDTLYIYNFFPTQKGADELKSKEIAANKLFMIHQSLGEDAKIFAPDEIPEPSTLYKRLTQNPEDMEEEGFETRIRQEYLEIKAACPQQVKQAEALFPRVKTAAEGQKDELYVFRRKGLGMFVLHVPDTMAGRPEVKEITFKQGVDAIKAKCSEPDLGKGPGFARAYVKALNFSPIRKGGGRSENSVEQRAFNNLTTAKDLLRDRFSQEERDFIQTLIRDLREYFTLPKSTLRTLQEYDLNPDLPDLDDRVDGFKRALHRLMGMLGTDYLDRLKPRIKNLADEVVVAVEHRR